MRLVFLFLIVLSLEASAAREGCRPLRKIGELLREVISIQNPIDQLVQWETKFNAWEVPDTEFDIGLKPILPTEVQVLSMSPEATAELLRSLPYDPTRLWPVHPYSTGEVSKPLGTFYDAKGREKPKRDTRTPFFERTTSQTLQGHPTASRSVIIKGKDGHVYSLKMPTTHIRPDAKEIHRTDLIEEAQMASLMTNYLLGIEAKGQLPKNVVLLKDVAAVIERSSGNGYLIRDLTELNRSGFYYIPGFSMSKVLLEPTVGMRADVGALSQSIGRGYADFVLSTGLQFETPHGQNVLIEISSKGEPTGRIVLRDLSDTEEAIPQIIKFWKMSDSLGDLVNATNKIHIWPTIAGYSSLYSDSKTVTDSYFQRFDEVLGTNTSSLEPTERVKVLSNYLASPIGKQRLQKWLETGKN